MKRITEFKKVWAHKKAFMKVRNSNEALKTNISLWRCIRHDLGKSLNIILFGDNIATKIHRKLAGHHNFRSKKDRWEAFCEWECARYTKPEKPLDGYMTWQKYYDYLPMQDIVDEFNKASMKLVEIPLKGIKYHYGLTFSRPNFD